ncbi:MAG: flotillin-like FloA family protein [Clostridiales bacterium]|nr:flotillin-like FloA family protein [Clostridiales bacterium]
MPVSLWVKARNAGVKVGMIDLMGMRMRRTPPAKIVLPYIRAIQAGLNLNVRQLESHYLVGGNAENVVDAMIEAGRTGSPLPFERAAAVDLAGRNVLEAADANDL